jgi:hypothetical protein
MKKLLFLLFMGVSSAAFSQVAVSFHQSNLPFVGVSYDINERLRPELRIEVDSYLTDVPLELVLIYDIVNNEDYEFCVGLGGRTQEYNGLVVPLGVNIYPFENKSFGFMVELAPILGENDILRGSWGIRYRFK